MVTKKSETWEGRVIEELLEQIQSNIRRATRLAEHRQDDGMKEVLDRIQADFNHIIIGFDTELHTPPKYEWPQLDEVQDRDE